MIRPLLVTILFCFLVPIITVNGDFSNDSLTTTDYEPVIVTVDSTNFRFTPSEVTIYETQELRFFWSDEILGHNAVEENGIFDSGNPETDVDYSFIFEVGTNGTYTYICEPHELMGMEGIVIVKPIIAESPSPVQEESNQEVSEKSLPNFLLPSTLMILIFASKINLRKSL